MQVVKQWSRELEGLRGLASLWVVLGHVCILVDFHFPILSDPAIGVDLFILLSGFLMAKNYIERKEIEPWTATNTIRKFWLRRFFRIAPLYYILLIIAISLGHYYGEYRDIIANSYSSTQTNSSRYNDNSFVNIFTHVTFIFGFLPDFSFNTVLPDWSIGLEMQFYFLFPFIMLLVMSIGFSNACFSIVIVCLAAKFIFPGYFSEFPMPSMILIKLYLFIAGMFVAYAICNKKSHYVIFAIITTLASFYLQNELNKLRPVAEMCMVVTLAVVLWPHNEGGFWKKTLRIPHWILTNKVSVFMGDVSYSVYLLHLLIVLPIVAAFLSIPAFTTLSAHMRFIISLVAILPITYCISYFLYKFIERPGIKLGKKLMVRGLKEKSVIN